MLDVRKLRLLRELAHRGTIAAVAEALSYTPSAVSQQLTALERETGVPLLERTGRRVTLTPAAHGLVARTESILALLNAAAADLENASRALSGVLRIGAFPTAVRPLITPALVALSTQHPALSLTVCELDPAAVPDALRTETVDLALLQHYDHLPRPHHPSLQTDPLHTDPVHLATPAPPPTSPDTRHPMPSPTPPTTPPRTSTPPHHLGPNSTPPTAHPHGTCPPSYSGADHATTTEAPAGLEQAHADTGVPALADLADWPWIAGTPGTLCHELTIRACEAAGFTPSIRHHADDFGAVLALVAAGQGAAFIPDLALTTPPPGVLLTPLPINRHTYLAYRRGTRNHPAITAARQALHTAARQAHPTP